MYKRKVRILFVSLRHAACARSAADHARRLEDDWIESRHACVAPLPGGEPCDDSVSAQDRVAESSGAEGLEWVDLVVTLCGDAETFRLNLPLGTQHRHWTPVDQTDGGLCVASPGGAAEIERRIRGILGGIRLLARSD